MDEKKAELVRQALESCIRPIFFFHDDPDGATSFLQLYKLKGEGKGVIVKTGPVLNEDMVRRVAEFDADKIFVLDLAMIEQGFIENTKVPIVWLDHHDIVDHFNTTYINSRSWGDETPPCVMAYYITGKADPWIALVGSCGDWYTPPKDLVEVCKEKYPGLFDDSAVLPEDFSFKTRVGELIQILSFNLKGTSSDAMNSLKVFARIEGPMELLDQSTPRAKWLVRRYQKIKTSYESLKKDAIAALEKQKGIVAAFTSERDRYAITKDLSNELSYLFPDKVLLIGREKNSEIRTSIRSSRHGPIIDKAVERSLVGLEARGGGHPHACGANIKKEDFSRFIDNLRRELSVE